jgi:toxin-antitoxin system PIN domain toxin
VILPDVNVLVYAHHESSVDHERYRTWWEGVVNGPTKFALVDQVLAGLMRVVTHARIFENPMSIQDALAAAEAIRSHPNCLILQSSPRQWEVFRDLCTSAGAVGNQVPDAYLAAVAITSGSEFITADKGFARYQGLRWRHPLTAS